MSKIIMVLGNANSGKTTLSYFLGTHLCKGDSRVMIVSTNNSAPSLQYILPEDKKGTRSLGRLLSLALITQKDILDNMQTMQSNSNLGFLSYANNENRHTFPEITGSNLSSFFELLSTLVDYIIVDSSPVLNIIDTFAQSIADTKLCICTADIKGQAYRNQQSDEEITHILYNDDPCNPYEDISHTYKRNVKYHVPLLKGMRTLYNGEMLTGFCYPIKYSKPIEKLIKEVIDVEQSS